MVRSYCTRIQKKQGTDMYNYIHSTHAQTIINLGHHAVNDIKGKKSLIHKYVVTLRGQ